MQGPYWEIETHRLYLQQERYLKNNNKLTHIWKTEESNNGERKSTDYQIGDWRWGRSWAVGMVDYNAIYFFVGSDSSIMRDINRDQVIQINQFVLTPAKKFWQTEKERKSSQKDVAHERNRRNKIEGHRSCSLPCRVVPDGGCAFGWWLWYGGLWRHPDPQIYGVWNNRTENELWTMMQGVCV